MKVGESPAWLKEKLESIIQEIEEHVVEEVDQNIFKECLNLIGHMLKTNYFIASKTGLAFRISPEKLN